MLVHDSSTAVMGMRAVTCRSNISDTSDRQQWMMGDSYSSDGSDSSDSSDRSYSSDSSNGSDMQEKQQ